MVNINFLLEKPLWQMSGEEFCQLTRFLREFFHGANTYLAYNPGRDFASDQGLVTLYYDLAVRYVIMCSA